MTMTTIMTAQPLCKPPAPPIKLTQQATRNFWESFPPFYHSFSFHSKHQTMHHFVSGGVSKRHFFSHLNFFHPGSFLSHLQSLHRLSICSGNFKRVLCRSGLKMMKTLWLAKLRKGFLLSSFLLLFPGLAQVKYNSCKSRQML